jgi:hypothetical protein
MNVVAVNDNSRTTIEDFVAGINAFFDLLFVPWQLVWSWVTERNLHLQLFWHKLVVIPSMHIAIVLAFSVCVCMSVHSISCQEFARFGYSDVLKIQCL